MQKLMKTAAAIALAAGATLTAGAAAAPTASATGTYAGCPYGAVCVYPQNAGWNHGHPSLIFYSYGAHNLSNQYGTHRIFNNQYGGAIARTCTGYNGAGCQGALRQFTYMDKNLTPINSIVLARHP